MTIVVGIVLGENTHLPSPTCKHEHMVPVDLAHALADECVLVLHAVPLIQNKVPAARHSSHA